MSLTFKIGSLAIRTLAKPISNYIKRNATEHENFRRLCVNFAQRLHRIDMRLRLGLLQDPAAIDRQIQRELREAEKKRVKDAAPTVKTEAETKADEEAQQKERKGVEEQVKAAHKPPRIRPLSENKAIETGATFIAETFLFVVAGALILAESWRRDRKEKKQDADVSDALTTAEKEREEMRQKIELLQAEIEALMDDKKPFDSVRAAAVASIRQIPHTTFNATDSQQNSKSPVTEADPTASVSASTPTSPTAANESVKLPQSTAAPVSRGQQEKLKEPSTIPPAVDAKTTAQSATASETTERSREEEKSDSSSASSWLPISWLGGGNKKSGAS